MSKKEKLSQEALDDFKEIDRIANEAVKRAKEENRRLGIPSAFWKDGRVHYEMPDGTITDEDPFDDLAEEAAAQSS